MAQLILTQQKRSTKGRLTKSVGKSLGKTRQVRKTHMAHLSPRQKNSWQRGAIYHIYGAPFMIPLIRIRVARFYVHTKHQNWKNVPNDTKMYQMVMKYPKCL
jgi:hypothetical protein